MRSLALTDQVVEGYRPYVRPVWMTAKAFAARPLTLTVRECRYEVTRSGFRVRTVTLVTTLLDPVDYPSEALATLYFQRWRVETDLAHLKPTLGMDVLRCETEAGVLKEIHVFAIVYNLVRLVMFEASRRQGVSVERSSFDDALRWLSSPPASAELPEPVVNLHRPGRVEPRCK